MLYDLNVPWSTATQPTLERTLSFLAELNHDTIALNHSLTGAVPAQITNPIPTTLPFNVPKSMTILRRCTLTVTDPAQNYRVPVLAQAYDIFAVRPVTEPAFLGVCLNAQPHISIISLDLTVRYPWHFKPTPLMTAVNRGIKLEICYSQALGDGNSEKRRNFISNAMALVRATKGRGIIVSSEAKSVLGVRAMADVANLMGIWGMTRERATEAQTTAPRSVIVNERINRRGFRGIVEVIEPGERIVDHFQESREAQKGGKQKQKQKPSQEQTNQKTTESGSQQGKRKVNDSKDGEETPKISKRQEKRMKVAATRAEREKNEAFRSGENVAEKEQDIPQD